MKKLRFLTQDEIIRMIHKGEKDFSNVKLVGTNLERQKLDGAIFRNSVLESVRFAYASLVGADFSGAKMEWGGFLNANLTRTSFQRAKILFIYFGDAILDKTDFRFAEITNCYFGGTALGGADFNNAKINRIITSWSEVTEEEINTALRIFSSFAERVNLSKTRVLLIKSTLHAAKVATNVKLTYDRGLNSIKSFIYEHKESEKIHPNTYSPHRGIYTPEKGYKDDEKKISRLSYKRK